MTMCESFFATLECELLDRVTLRTPAEARTAVFGFIEGWYNPTRRHSSLDYESPLSFERRHADHRPEDPATRDTADPGGYQSSATSTIVPPRATGTAEVAGLEAET